MEEKVKAIKSKTKPKKLGIYQMKQSIKRNLHGPNRRVCFVEVKKKNSKLMNQSEVVRFEKGKFSVNDKTGSRDHSP